MILSIETSTDVCSVALSEGGQTTAHLEHFEAGAHAAKLTPLIEQMTKENGISMKQIKAVAVSSGPGSYTGLRIGASTAKGICYALGVPLIAIPTLDLIAHTILSQCSECDIAVPMIDARRMEVYTQAVARNGERLMDVAPLVVGKDSFAAIIASGKKIAFGGNGAMKCKDLVSAQNTVVLDNINPLAKDMSELAYSKLQANETESVAYFEPFYLKEFIATTPKNKVF